MLFSATDGAASVGKKDKFLVEWVPVLDTDDQSDAKTLWANVAAERPTRAHKLAAMVARRPDSDPASFASSTAAAAARKRRNPSKLAASLTVPDSADLAAFAASEAGSTTAVAAVAAVAAPTITVSHHDHATTAASSSANAATPQTPAAAFATPQTTTKLDDAEVKELRAQLVVIQLERDKLANQLTAAQRALSAATAARPATASKVAQKPAPATGIAKHLYLIAILLAIFAFLFGRFSTTTTTA